MTISVKCLPVAGPDNPYQNLMMEGLRKHPNIVVSNGVKGAFFTGTRTCAKYKPDFIHYDWINSYARKRNTFISLLNLPLFVADILIVILFYSRTKLVCTVHNIYPHDTEITGWHIWIRNFFYSKVKWIRVFSSSTVSEFCEFYSIGDREKFKVIPEGSYVGHYPAPVDRNVALEFLKIPSSRRTLLYLGRLHPYKGLEEFIPGFREAAKKGDRLIIAGGSSIEGYVGLLKQLIGNDERIIFHPGFIDENHLRYYFSAADVVVLPFRKVENSGSVIMAMGFGKAVIAPANGVVSLRLHSQSELLYPIGTKAVDIAYLALRADAQILQNAGLANLSALNAHKWTDFQKAFIN